MNKFNNKIGRFTIFALFLISIFLINIQPVNAQESNVCCALPGFGCTGLTFDEPPSVLDYNWCNTQDGEYYDSACSQVPNQLCEPGCCCIYNTDGQLTDGGEIDAKFLCPDENYFSQIPATGTCANTCASSFLTVSGNVFYSNDEPANAQVVFEAGPATNSMVYTTSSNNAGYFEFLVGAEKTYSVTVTETDSRACSKIFSPLTVQTTDIENTIYKLDCLPVGVQCEDSWDIVFSDQENSCGTVESVTYTGDCANPNSNPPYNVNDEITCLPGSSTCNPDSIRQAGEECDPFEDPANFPMCDLGDYQGGRQTCNIDCKFSNSTCLTCPTNPIYCTEELCGGVCDACLNSIVCETASTCNAVPLNEIVTLNSVSAVQEDIYGFDVEWELNEACQSNDVLNLQILGKNVDNPDSPGTLELNNHLIVSGVDSQTTSFFHQPFNKNFNQYFCYQIVANRALPMQSARSEIVCQNFKTDVCRGIPDGGSVCQGNTYVECQDESSVNPNTCQGMCVEVSDNPPKAECFDVSVCDYCSGSFGMFGYKDIPLTTEYELLFSGGAFTALSSCQDLQAEEICYMDDFSKENTLIGQYHACDLVSSCYDYRTEESCNSNPCGAIQDNSCDWTPYPAGEELGIGVCVPKAVEDQDCSVCDDNSAFGICTKDICELYGTQNDGEEKRCFFNQVTSEEFITDEGTCINREQVSCETYDSKEQCQGANAFTINLEYYSNKEPKIGSNNQIIQFSQDVYDNGKCYWFEAENPKESKCLKDSDNTRSYENFPKSDCTSKDFNCLLDFESPVTTLNLIPNGKYSIPELNGMTFDVTDNVYSGQAGDNIQTFFHLIDAELQVTANNQPYPKLKKEELVFENAGNYNLLYYSMDKSQNREEVKSMIINILPKLENTLSLSLDKVSSYVLTSDIYETNLSVKVNGYNPANTDSWLKCTATLTNNLDDTISFQGRGDGTKLHPNLEWNYLTLEDGDYRLEVECWDDHLQIITLVEESIQIQGDPTISNPTPRRETFAPGQIEISIETVDDASCGYTDSLSFTPPIPPRTTNLIGSGWKEFEETGGKIHKSVIDEEEGFALYKVSCRFTDENGDKYYFYGNEGDMIYYAVDGTAPNVKVYDFATSEIYNPLSAPTESLKLGFECNDTSVLYAGQDLSFGCGNDWLYYCIRQGRGSCTNFKQITDNSNDIWFKTFSAPPDYIRYYLTLKTVDTGANEKIYPAFELTNLQNTSFEPPRIVICDPEKGINCELPE